MSAAVAVRLPARAAAPALASGEPGVVRPDDRRLVSDGHWSRTAEAATVDSGSRPPFRFTGGGVRALFGVASVTLPAQIHVSADGGPKRLYAVGRSGPDSRKGRAASVCSSCSSCSSCGFTCNADTGAATDVAGRTGWDSPPSANSRCRKGSTAPTAVE
ncbi:hypothetical protein [Streptomyces europaeiscabiei]|uniref:hypothetical protein n=1 Tax=Streptomyces europaeiscabiei TaxID=146819 RepID=UPI0029A12ADB|nr:hypothetical protein [Streptomyces europaeiscabiei]MDX3612961.1 hypothetical protein [Streptomyces europaeiscabiei]